MYVTCDPSDRVEAGESEVHTHQSIKEDMEANKITKQHGLLI